MLLPEITPDTEKLRAYTQTKLELASQLRTVREALTTLGRENAERQCAELIVKLAEDRFILAVLGQFKRGKSSLMNAIIGRELLPTGVLPLTSAITILKYGPTEKLVINREDSGFPQELPVSSLPGYVTEKGNPGNQKKVKTACVELPVPFLRRGLEFVDTPGVGSAIMANTATTYSFLPECDAVLFVTSADMPMTSLELEFLKEIREYVNKIFFVVNKIDLVTENERDEVISFVTETIRTQTGSDSVKVFSVSARLGLTARMSGDKLLYEQSGLKALEEALASFLSGEKLSIFLAAMANKTLRILDGEVAQGAFEEAALQARIRSIQEEKTVTLYRDPYAAVAAINKSREKLEAIYNNIRIGQKTELEESELSSSVATESGPTRKTAIGKSMSPIVNLAEDLTTKECPVCRHITKQASDFFAHWQYQISSNEEAQAEFAAELGFCPVHTWQLFAMSSPHGASVGFARLTEHIAHRLKEYKDQPAGGRKVNQLVHDSATCRVCKILREVEEKYIHQLSAQLNETDGMSKYHHSQGVCLRHLGMLMDAGSSAEIQKFLIAHAVQRFEEDAEDMRSFALKGEALRRALQNRNEEDAYKRAIIRMVGGRCVCHGRKMV
jgi:GTP-binding protein EngB required for normal cell division